ncbi:MAG TPA: hypothetical protein VGO51_12645 [Burkholderiaceae bacterium]|jgi:ElaB/YqjD/DUF883 family membrane-anchored ribosome-binding protein|nr:hypothetical protein [Burkholderiaceae bacterium]
MDSPKILPAGTNGSNGAWDRTVDQASTTVHKTIDKLADAARPAVDRLSSGAHQAVDRISGAATQAAMTLSEKIGPIQNLQEQLIEDVRVHVREKPVAALAIAIAAGFLLSQLLRSR